MIPLLGRRGADLPFADPLRHHGVRMEGYFWRLVAPDADRVIAVVCGILDGERALVAVAAHPEPVLVERQLPRAWADSRRLGLRVGDSLSADARELRVDLGPGARLTVRLGAEPRWPPRPLPALGLAHLVPGMNQYWHPYLLGVPIAGWAEVGAGRIDLDGWRAYAEKNWGPRFPARWWWGAAHDLPEACVAFAGGPAGFGPVGLPATCVVVRFEGRIIRLVAPGALVRARVGAGRWSIAARSPRFGVDIDAEAGDSTRALPVPPGRPGADLGRVAHRMAGALHVEVRDRGRLVWTGDSRLAALEDGRS